MNWLWRSLAVLVGLLFIYTGAIKISDPIGFAGDIENYHLVPWAIGAPLAFYLPWLELFCGIALIVRRLRAGAIVVLSALMLIFIAAGIAAKARGIDISCGCFGHASDQLSFAWHLVLDFVILAALLLLWRWEYARQQRPRLHRLPLITR